MQQFRVISYEFGGYDGLPIIKVMCVNREREETLDITRERFEFWLLTSGKLTWQIVQQPNEVYRAEEVEGVMSLTEYWAQEDIVIWSDLAQYISTRTTNYYISKLAKLKS